MDSDIHGAFCGSHTRWLMYHAGPCASCQKRKQKQSNNILFHILPIPNPAAILDAYLAPAGPLLRADFQPVPDEDDTGLDHEFLEMRSDFRKTLGHILAAETHHPFYSVTGASATLDSTYVFLFFFSSLSLFFSP
jgi:hypothetical protein